MVRGTFSPARAWRPAVGPASTRTLGRTKTFIVREIGISNTPHPWMVCLRGFGRMVRSARSCINPEQHQRAEWIHVRATILSSAPKQNCGKGSSYTPQVSYKYSVGGTERIGRIISESHFDCGSYEEMKRRTDKYTVGQEVVARVNPLNPEQAILEAGEPNPDSWFGISVLAAMAFGCTYFAAKAWRGAA